MRRSRELRKILNRVDKLQSKLHTKIEGIFKHDYSSSQAFSWTSPMVGAWLCIIGLKEYLDIFLENGVDGITLLRLDSRKFQKCLGIETKNHLESLRAGLTLLKNSRIDYSKWEWSCSGVTGWLEKRSLTCVSKIFETNAVHGGVLFTFTQKSLHNFLARVPTFDMELISPLAFKSLWLAIKRVKETGTSRLYPDRFVQDWGETEIEIWLKSINLPHLNEKFKRHGINGTVLTKLKRRELSEIVGTTEIQTIVIMRHIRFLRMYVKGEKENASELLSRDFKRNWYASADDTRSEEETQTYSTQASDPDISSYPRARVISVSDSNVVKVDEAGENYDKFSFMGRIARQF